MRQASTTEASSFASCRTCTQATLAGTTQKSAHESSITNASSSCVVAMLRRAQARLAVLIWQATARSHPTAGGARRASSSAHTHSEPTQRHRLVCAFTRIAAAAQATKLRVWMHWAPSCKHTLWPKAQSSNHDEHSGSDAV